MVESLPCMQLAGAVGKKNQTDPETGITTEQPAKKPETLEDKTNSSVQVSICCIACSILCVCTIPGLVFAVPAYIAATTVRNYMNTL